MKGFPNYFLRSMTMPVVMSLVLLTSLAFGETPLPKTTPFGAATVIIELTDNDIELQVLVDGQEKAVEVFDPQSRKIFGSDSMQKLIEQGGASELYWASQPTHYLKDEPEYDGTIGDFLSRFPSGKYMIKGVTTDQESLESEVALTHNLPALPKVVSPVSETDTPPVIDPNNLVIDWDPVTTWFTYNDVKYGSGSVDIIEYQVILDEEVKRDQPWIDGTTRRALINLPPTVTSFAVPPEFLLPGTTYNFEILAIEASGNSTISTGVFVTPGSSAAADSAIPAFASKKTTPFGAATVIIELTDNDIELQVLVDGQEKAVEVFDPQSRKIFGSDSMQKLIEQGGVSELYWASQPTHYLKDEPEYDGTIGDFLSRFPSGKYMIKGVTTDQESLESEVALTHNLPALPKVVSPVSETDTPPVIDPNNLVIDWDPVTTWFTYNDVKYGSGSVDIIEYQVILDEEVKRDQPWIDGTTRRALINLPPTVTSFVVPPEFLLPDTTYNFEILAIEASGNSTISTGVFVTPDYATDTDQDGISDLTEGNKDTDNDGTPDYKESNVLDSDGDRIPDHKDPDSTGGTVVVLIDDVKWNTFNKKGNNHVFVELAWLSTAPGEVLPGSESTTVMLEYYTKDRKHLLLRETHVVYDEFDVSVNLASSGNVLPDGDYGVIDVKHAYKRGRKLRVKSVSRNLSNVEVNGTSVTYDHEYLLEEEAQEAFTTSVFCSTDTKQETINTNSQNHLQPNWLNLSTRYAFNLKSYRYDATTGDLASGVQPIETIGMQPGKRDVSGGHESGPQRSVYFLKPQSGAVSYHADVNSFAYDVPAGFFPKEQKYALSEPCVPENEEKNRSKLIFPGMLNGGCSKRYIRIFNGDRNQKMKVQIKVKDGDNTNHLYFNKTYYENPIYLDPVQELYIPLSAFSLSSADSTSIPNEKTVLVEAEVDTSSFVSDSLHLRAKVCSLNCSTGEPTSCDLMPAAEALNTSGGVSSYNTYAGHSTSAIFCNDESDSSAVVVLNALGHKKDSSNSTDIIGSQSVYESALTVPGRKCITRKISAPSSQYGSVYMKKKEGQDSDSISSLVVTTRMPKKGVQSYDVIQNEPIMMQKDSN